MLSGNHSPTLPLSLAFRIGLGVSAILPNEFLQGKNFLNSRQRRPVWWIGLSRDTATISFLGVYPRLYIIILVYTSGYVKEGTSDVSLAI